MVTFLLHTFLKSEILKNENFVQAGERSNHLFQEYPKSTYFTTIENWYFATWMILTCTIWLMLHHS